tara:strand:+ start:736 stop:921 length:186 start_codon:yes stop_codon:yes gene_type:complete
LVSSSWEQLKAEPLEILGLWDGGEDRMVWALAVGFNKAQCPARVYRSVSHVIEKQFPGNMM